MSETREKTPFRTAAGKRPAKPENPTPPFEAANPDFPADLPFIGYAQFGVQCRPGAPDPAPVLAALYHAFHAPGGPKVVEQGVSVHGDGRAKDGLTTHIVYAYWRTPEDRDAWMKIHLDAVWWGRPEASSGPTGLWCERIDIDTARTECLYAHQDHATGYASFAGKKRSLYHGYFGALRHRMPASDWDDFAESPGIDMNARVNAETLGRDIEVTPPANIVLIRTSQDWSKATAWEREYYFRDVEHHLIHAAHALDGDSADAGCFDSYFVRETDAEGRVLERSNVTACFRSLDALEEWTWHHPDHLAIFRAAMDMIRQGGNAIMLNLWAEVTVFPEGRFTGRYANCLPATGLLPYFEGREKTSR